MPTVKSTLEIDLVDDVSKNAKTVAAALEKTQKDAVALQAALSKSGASDRLQSALQKIGASAVHVDVAAKSWQAYAKAEGIAGKAGAELTKQQIAGIKNWEGITVSSLRAVMSEERALARTRAFQAAEATRSAEREAAARIRAMERETRAARQEAEKQREAIARGGVGHMVAGAAGGALAAHSIFRVTEQGLESGAERQHVRVGMMNAGISKAEIAQFETEAQRAAKRAPNLSTSEILELGKEARSSVQHAKEAHELLPMLAQASSILRGMGVENASITDVVKGAESLGLMNNPERFKKYLSSQIKAMSVMGKTITTEQIYESAKYSKASGATLSDEFLNLVMPSLIQEMHGSSAGEALSMLSRTVRGGLQKKHIPTLNLKRIGMLAQPGRIKYAHGSGEIMGYTGKVVGDDLLASDPDRFAKILDEHMEAHGIKKFEDKTKFLQETLPGTAANLIRILIQQRETLANHRELYKSAADLDQAQRNQTADPVSGLTNLKKSIDDLGASVTGPGMEAIGKVMSSVADGMRSLSDVAKDTRKPR